MGNDIPTRLAVLENNHNTLTVMVEGTVKKVSLACEQIAVALHRLADHDQQKSEVSSEFREIKNMLNLINNTIPPELEKRLLAIEKDLPPLVESRKWFISGALGIVALACSVFFEMFTK